MADTIPAVHVRAASGAQAGPSLRHPASDGYPIKQGAAPVFLTTSEPCLDNSLEVDARIATNEATIRHSRRSKRKRRLSFLGRLLSSCLCIRPRATTYDDDGEHVHVPQALKEHEWKLPYVARQRSPLRGVPRHIDPLRQSAASLNCSGAGPLTGRNGFAEDVPEKSVSPVVPGAASVPNFASPVAAATSHSQAPGSVRAKRALELNDDVQGLIGTEEVEVLPPKDDDAATEDPTTPRSLPSEASANPSPTTRVRIRRPVVGASPRLNRTTQLRLAAAEARKEAEQTQRLALLKKVSPSKLDRLLHGGPSNGIKTEDSKQASSGRPPIGPKRRRSEPAAVSKPVDAGRPQESATMRRRIAAGRPSYVDELRSRAAAAEARGKKRPHPAKNPAVPKKIEEGEAEEEITHLVCPSPGFRPLDSTNFDEGASSAVDTDLEHVMPVGGSGGPMDREKYLEVELTGVDGELRRVAEEALTIKSNFTYTIDEVQAAMQKIFGTGLFSSCEPVADDTRDGVKLTLRLTPNPEISGVVLTGAEALPAKVVEGAFAPVIGRPANFNTLRSVTDQLNAWYGKNGFVGCITSCALDDATNQVLVHTTEPRIASIKLRFEDRKTGEVKEEGRTRPEIILRHLNTQVGQLYSLRRLEGDLASVLGTGLFDDALFVPEAAENSTPEAPKVDLTLLMREKKSGGLSAGTGVLASGRGGAGGTNASSAAGVVGSASIPAFMGQLQYNQRNLFGLGQRLQALVELGQVNSSFSFVHEEPWIRGDPYRTSRTATLSSNKLPADAVFGPLPGGTDTSSSSFHVSRLSGNVEWNRPLGIGWTGALALGWQRATCLDESGRQIQQDCYGAPLHLGGKDHDTKAMGTLRLAYTPGSGNGQVMGTMEQAVPVQADWLNFNKFTLRADRALQLGPLTLWLGAKGGIVSGDLPPYDAFTIGGTNSVRGYYEGGVGTGRRYGIASAELHAPLVAPLRGVLFADYGTDFESGAHVLGDPAGARGKPGRGYGVGAGVRIQTPIGPVRLEYAWNDAGIPRFHLGIGARD